MYRCRHVNKIYSSKCSVCIEYKHSLLEAIDNKLLFILSLIILYCIMICLSLWLFSNLSRTLNKFYKRFNEEGIEVGMKKGALILEYWHLQEVNFLILASIHKNAIPIGYQVSIKIYLISQINGKSYQVQYKDPADKGCLSLGWSVSGSVIWDHLNHGRSNELMDPPQTRIHQFNLPWYEWSRITDLLIHIITKECTQNAKDYHL